MPVEATTPVKLVALNNVQSFVHCQNRGPEHCVSANNTRSKIVPVTRIVYQNYWYPYEYAWAPFAP
eukprot:scaffold93278_cov23-Prasinocladus_malaysianus.AAC.1